MKSKYVIWKSKEVPNCCSLKGLSGVEDLFEFRKGISRVATFPDDAVFSMDPDFPHNMMLTDNLISRPNMIVTSRKLKEFLEERKLKNVEYLNVNIRDHKGKIASKDYFIVHPIYPVDCLDLDKCQARWSEIDKDVIQKLKYLVIDDSKIDPDLEMFRIKFFYKIVVLHRELAQAIDAAGFEGIRWIELDKYRR